MFKRYKRSIVVGDIHGCIDELLLLLKNLRFNQNSDQLILAGDMINKGPYSYEVLEWIFEHPTTICLLGNHEIAFLRYLSGNFRSPIFNTLKRKLGKDLIHIKKWIQELPEFYEDTKKIVVHAGLEPRKPLLKQKTKILTNIRTWDGSGENLKDPRNLPWYDFYNNKKPVIFGHWAAKGLIKRPNAIGLDTGCVYGGSLSALVLPEFKVYSVKAKKTYQAITK